MVDFDSSRETLASGSPNVPSLDSMFSDRGGVPVDIDTDELKALENLEHMRRRNGPSDMLPEFGSAREIKEYIVSTNNYIADIDWALKALRHPFGRNVPALGAGVRWSNWAVDCPFQDCVCPPGNSPVDECSEDFLSVLSLSDGKIFRTFNNRKGPGRTWYAEASAHGRQVYLAHEGCGQKTVAGPLSLSQRISGGLFGAPDQDIFNKGAIGPGLFGLVTSGILSSIGYMHASTHFGSGKSLLIMGAFVACCTFLCGLLGFRQGVREAERAIEKERDATLRHFERECPLSFARYKCSEGFRSNPCGQAGGVLFSLVKRYGFNFDERLVQTPIAEFEQARKRAEARIHAAKSALRDHPETLAEQARTRQASDDLGSFLRLA